LGPSVGVVRVVGGVGWVFVARCIWGLEGLNPIRGVESLGRVNVVRVALIELCRGGGVAGRVGLCALGGFGLQRWGGVLVGLPGLGA
jgi:hypothetical protein